MPIYMCMTLKRFLCFLLHFKNKTCLLVVPVKAVHPMSVRQPSQEAAHTWHMCWTMLHMLPGCSQLASSLGQMGEWPLHWTALSSTLRPLRESQKLSSPKAPFSMSPSVALEDSFANVFFSSRTDTHKVPQTSGVKTLSKLLLLVTCCLKHYFWPSNSFGQVVSLLVIWWRIT